MAFLRPVESRGEPTIQLGYHLPYVLPSISARVIHETAEVVAELRSRR